MHLAGLKKPYIFQQIKKKVFFIIIWELIMYAVFTGELIMYAVYWVLFMGELIKYAVYWVFFTGVKFSLF